VTASNHLDRLLTNIWAPTKGRLTESYLRKCLKITEQSGGRGGRYVTKIVRFFTLIWFFLPTISDSSATSIVKYFTRETLIRVMEFSYATSLIDNLHMCVHSEKSKQAFLDSVNVKCVFPIYITRCCKKTRL
jgi:hypothetical protein